MLLLCGVPTAVGVDGDACESSPPSPLAPPSPPSPLTPLVAADWGPTGLAAGKEFFPTDEQSGNQSLLAMPVPDASLIPERPSVTPADLAWAGLEVTAGSVRLPAVLPAALLGQRYGRAALPRLALDMCAFSAAGAVLAWNLLPDEIPWFQAPGMAPFGALLLVTARRVSARLTWQDKNAKKLSEGPDLEAAWGSTAETVSDRSYPGGWRRWEVVVLALCCGVAQWPCLSAALLGAGGGQEPPAKLSTQDVGAAVGGMAGANAALAVRPTPQPSTATYLSFTLHLHSSPVPESQTCGH